MYENFDIDLDLEVLNTVDGHWGILSNVRVSMYLFEHTRTYESESPQSLKRCMQ